MATTAEDYLTRFHKVLEFIETHLDEELSVDRLGSVAAYSKYHFHRQFSGIFGISVCKYVQMSRLKRASFQLAFRQHNQVIDIALANGYEGPDSFARAFKKTFEQTPSEFRKRPHWDCWCEKYQSFNQLRREHMKRHNSIEQVQIVNFKETKVAVLEHRGDPRLIGDSIRQFIEWRKENRLSPKVSATFNIAYDDPREVAPEDYRFDLCASIDMEVKDNSAGIVCKTIPGGRCAVIKHIGTDDTLENTVRFLYSEWLPRSGEELRDFPVYFQRIKFFPDVPENESIVGVFLPLKD